jgi:hypothetical protein
MVDQQQEEDQEEKNGWMCFVAFRFFLPVVGQPNPKTSQPQV